MKTSNPATVVNSANCKNQPVAAFQNQSYLDLARRQKKEGTCKKFEDLKKRFQDLYKSGLDFSTFIYEA